MWILKNVCICKTTFSLHLYLKALSVFGVVYSKLIARAKRANNSTNAQVFVYIHGHQRIVHTAHELSQHHHHQQQHQSQITLPIPFNFKCVYVFFFCSLFAWNAMQRVKHTPKIVIHVKQMYLYVARLTVTANNKTKTRHKPIAQLAVHFWCFSTESHRTHHPKLHTHFASLNCLLNIP